MQIALLVDNPNRDLSGMVLLAVYLVQQGATCYLVPMNLKEKEVGALAPDFVLLNYLRTSNEEFARHALEAGISVGVLDTEGGILENWGEYAQVMAKDSAVRQGIACYCSWGERLAEHARRERWYRDGRVFVTGAPRFDFYRHPWRAAALDTSPYVDAYRSPLVLVNGTFAVGNPRFKSLEREAQLLVETGGYHKDYVEQWQREDRQGIRDMVDLINGLARCMPEVTFVYRPHPFERLETYQELFEPHENLHLVQTGPVDGWILRASAIIQRGCSTSIEGGMAGVPSLSPTWITTPVPLPPIEAVSIPCHSQGEVAQRLERIIQGDAETPEPIARALDQVIKDWYHAADGKAHQRVATAVLESVASNERRSVDRSRCRRIHYRLHGKGRSVGGRIANTARMRLGLPSNWSFYRGRPISYLSWDHSGKYFDVSRVQQLVTAVQACQPATAPRVAVASAQKQGAYHFAYPFGRSVVLAPG